MISETHMKLNLRMNYLPFSVAEVLRFSFLIWLKIGCLNVLEVLFVHLREMKFGSFMIPHSLYRCGSESSVLV